ncbi:MAG: 3-dehydroquinate synthase [Beijerinckiaceae bacterium]|jgi:3-dehydroquinate synthase|nr:3-dehydroquinate synthase [Beijerinckiaceae bacterium]
MSQGIATVPVPLPGRAYDIVIGRGVLAEAGRRIAALGKVRHVGIVTDEIVAPLHAAALEEALGEAGLVSSRITIPAGETSKSFAMFAHVSDGLLAARIERQDAVLALGGGVVGDLAGFAAATLRRGVRLVQVPTTLLAQVDSSVGGKTGINSQHGKNLIGAFHQPALVLADTALIDTLPLRERKAGYAEVVKYGLINDPDFFEWCEQHGEAAMAGGTARDHAVRVSCAAKAAIVLRDEHEHGDRALLNLGHTFAHAIERIVAYDNSRIVHGEAVSIGLALAFRFSQRLGLCPGQDAVRVTRHLARLGMPTTLADVPGGIGPASAMLEAMAQDKKVMAGKLTFILARGIGASFVARDVPAAEVLAFLDAELSGT